MNVVLYARCSTGHQAEADSIPTQLSRLHAWATRDEHTVLGVHTDAGLSGGTLARPGVHTAIAQACEHRAVLAVASLSRLGRNTRDVLECAERLHAAGASFTSLSESFVSDSAMGRLLTAVLAAVSAWELEAIRERTVATLDHLRRSGRRISRFPPYGWSFNEEGATLVEHPAEQMVLRDMRGARAAGRSYDGIADDLNGRGITAKLGGPWSGRAVRLILARLSRLDAA